MNSSSAALERDHSPADMLRNAGDMAGMAGDDMGTLEGVIMSGMPAEEHVDVVAEDPSAHACLPWFPTQGPSC